jgi:hypothetical protein
MGKMAICDRKKHYEDVGKALMENGVTSLGTDSPRRGYPADKFELCPAPWSQVNQRGLHANRRIEFLFCSSVTRPPMPPDIKSSDMEKIVTSKDDVIAFLNVYVLDAVKTARAQLKPGDFQRKVMNKEATVDGMYLLGTGTL